jgi:hypothetical protein
MDNVNFVDIQQADSTMATYAIIANPDGSFTSMLKAYYDAQQAAQVAPQA